MADALAITGMGMINGINQLNLIAHNLANANTVGFKRDISVTRSFSEHLSMADIQAKQAMAQDVADHRPGVMRYSGNALDIAIEGDGYLVVNSASGPMYTRQGTLTLDAYGRLVTAQGMPINGEEGEIRLTSDHPRIDKQGRVWEDDQYIGQLQVVHFSNPHQLEKVGSGLYVGGGAPKSVQGDDLVGVRQGYVEASNVNVMKEMVDLLSTMRQIESSQKILRGYDDMMELAMRTISDI